MFKLNISTKDGKTYKLELESEELMGKQLNDKIEGKDLNSDLSGYEFEITGTSDKAGFPASQNIEGIGLKRVLLTYGMGMHKRSKREGKKKRSNPRPKGLRLRKTMRGKVISNDIVQINMKVLKQGSKPLTEVFPDQNKPKEKVKYLPPAAETPAQ
ncbi:30S ribosomal protein S6e [Candidatus Pacearchaeota archaeon]|nr:30S ribosomal protein S6e [Candidatus Pacearchaeota archaeon]